MTWSGKGGSLWSLFIVGASTGLDKLVASPHRVFSIQGTGHYPMVENAVEFNLARLCLGHDGSLTRAAAAGHVPG